MPFSSASAFCTNGKAHLGKGELFNEAEDTHETQYVEPDTETTTVNYEHKQAKRKPLPAELPHMCALSTRVNLVKKWYSGSDLTSPDARCGYS